MPQPAFAAVVVIVAAAAAVNGAKVTGRLDASQRGRDAWQLWQECLGLFGLVILPQARALTLPLVLAVRVRLNPSSSLALTFRSSASTLSENLPGRGRTTDVHRRFASQTSRPIQS